MRGKLSTELDGQAKDRLDKPPNLWFGKVYNEGDSFAAASSSSRSHELLQDARNESSDL